MQTKCDVVVSTWLASLNSLKINQTAVERILKYAPQSSLVITGANENFYNSVMLCNPTDNAKLVEELRILQQELAHPLTAWVTKDTNSYDLEQALNEQFQSPGPFYGMLLDLNKANLTACSTNISIEPVSNSEEAEEFGSVFCKVFNFHPDLLERTANRAVLQSTKEPPSVYSYIARVHGVVAGVCALVIDEKFNNCSTGGLYDGCVLPEFRKLGVGTAMACYRIKVAQALGLQSLSIVLMSDGMARGYCNRLGFKKHHVMTPYYIF